MCRGPTATFLAPAVEDPTELFSVVFEKDPIGVLVFLSESVIGIRFDLRGVNGR